MLGRCLFSKGDSFLKVYTWVSPSVATYVCTLPWKLTHPLLTCSQSNSASCRSSSGWGVVTSSHGVLLQDDLFFPQNTGFGFSTPLKNCFFKKKCLHVFCQLYFSLLLCPSNRESLFLLPSKCLEAIRLALCSRMSFCSGLPHFQLQ